MNTKTRFSILRGAEYAFAADDCLCIISSGSVLELRVRIDESGQNLLTVEDRFGNMTILLKASQNEVFNEYVMLSDALLKKPSRLLHKVRDIAISVAAITFVALASVTYYEISQPLPQTSVEPSPMLDLSKIPDITKVPDLGGIGAANPLPLSNGIPLMTAPDFLKNAEAPKPQDHSEGVIKDAPVSQKNIPLVPPVKTVPQAPVSEPQKTSEAPVSQKPSAEAATAQRTDDEFIKKSADAAIKKMVGDGMTPETAKKLLLTLQEMSVAGDKGITPEMMKALPEEIAGVLTDQGMDLNGPNSGEMKILPTEVVDAYRGKDGISSIPENYSWYARTGGPVSIPLPGGGDIKSPDDLKDFGIKP